MTALIERIHIRFVYNLSEVRRKEDWKLWVSSFANGLGTVTVKREDLVRWFCLDRRPARLRRMAFVDRWSSA